MVDRGVNPVQSGRVRALFGLFGAGVGSLVGVVLTIVLVFTPQLFPPAPFHWVALLAVFGGPIIIGGLLGLGFPGRARELASGAVRSLEAWSLAITSRKR